MGPVIIVQFMVAAAFLTVALHHFLIWGRGERSREHLLFAATALAAAAKMLTMCGVYLATSVAAVVPLFKLTVLFAALWLIALIWFTATFTQASAVRRGWAGVLSAVFIVVIVVNFNAPGGWIFTEVTGLRESYFWGERLALPVGPLAHWHYLSDSALLGFLVFVIDGSVRLWHRGQRRRAVFLGGSIAVFIVAFGGYGLLLHHGLGAPPYLDGYAFLLVVLVMSYSLAGDVVRAAVLSREVEASERRWRSLLENVQLVVVGLDCEGRTDYVNPHTRHLLGYSAAEILGKPWFDLLIPAAERSSAWHEFRRLLREEHVPHYQNGIVTKTGELLQISWSTVRLRNMAGVVTGILAIGEDITARWRAEMEVRRQRAELTHMARLTTMGELAASLAHELNQPLTAILSNAQVSRRLLVAAEPDLTEIGEILDDIVQDDRRAAEIIRRIRALVKKDTPRLTEFDLVTVVGDVITLLHADAVQHNVRVTFAPAPGLPPIKGDSVQLQQVVLNLLVNAFDAVKTNPATKREVVVRVDSDGPEAVRVTVRDNGSGLPAAVLERVFEPFYTTKAEGLGMGLAISRSIIIAHGGRLWAENNRGRGATFAFTLPAAAANQTI